MPPVCAGELGTIGGSLHCLFQGRVDEPQQSADGVGVTKSLVGVLVRHAANTSAGKTWRRYVAVLGGVGVIGLCTMSVQARDDGRFANSPLKAWFDSLRSKSGGSCCSDADGMAISDVDWDTKDGHYRVRLDGEWVDVPGDAVITVPNRAGHTMVWPYYVQGHAVIRCFLPGTMT